MIKRHGMLGNVMKAFRRASAPKKAASLVRCPYGYAPPATAKPAATAPVLTKPAEITKPAAKEVKPKRAQASREFKGSYPIPVRQTDLNGNTIHQWKSVTEASRVLGINKNTIYHNCQGRSKTVNKMFKFSYIKA